MELSPTEGRCLSWVLRNRSLLNRAEDIPGRGNSMLNGTEVERKKDTFKNIKTPSLVSTCDRRAGKGGDEAAELSVQGLRQHSGLLDVSLGTMQSP